MINEEGEGERMEAGWVRGEGERGGEVVKEEGQRGTKGASGGDYAERERERDEEREGRGERRETEGGLEGG